MAQGETNIVNAIMIDLSRANCTLWKNVRGNFCTIDSVKILIAAALALNPIRIKQAIKTLRRLSAGLQAPGASDLIGFRRVKITPDMVGMTIAQFVSLEVKQEGNYASPNQRDFCDFIIENGGFSGVARSPADARRICNISG